MAIEQEQRFPIRPHLTDSARLQWNLHASTEAARAAIEALVQELEAGEDRPRKRKERDRRSLWDAMEAMVLGLVDASATTRPWRAYSRRNVDYTFFVDHGSVSHKSVTTVADFLMSCGLAEGRRGAFGRPDDKDGKERDSGKKQAKHFGYQSRLKATPSLINRLQGLEDAIVPAPVAHPIRVKGPKDAQGRKPLRRRDAWPDLRGMDADASGQRVLEANRLRASCHISLEGGGGFASYDDGTDPEDRVSPQDRHAVHLYRVFSNDSWRQGGRFYGGFWQGLPKADRKRLLIDGEETVELDYQACHVRMCYHLDGQPLPTDADPYAIAGLSPDLRGAAKALILRLLGAQPGSRVMRPEALKEWSKKDYAGLTRQITQAHPLLSHWFRGGHWSTLQNLDSQIADAVLADLTSQGIPCLPVHDSFIVPRSGEVTLGLAMARAWRLVLSMEAEGIDGCPVVTGWTSQETEGAYHSPLPPLPVSASDDGVWKEDDPSASIDNPPHPLPYWNS